MTQTKRLTRKDLRGPDEFQTLSVRALEWADQNRRTVWIAAGAFVAVLVAIALTISIIQNRAETAAEQFYGASELFKREQWTEALASFTAIADDYGSTTYGRLSRLYAARSALRAGEAARAVELYREYLDGPIESDAVEQLARLDLATALEKTGDANAARAEVERAFAMSGPAKLLAQIRLAGFAEAAGDRAKAIELYQAYLKDTPNGADAEVARARLIALGEVPPAAPPPIAPGALQFQ